MQRRRIRKLVFLAGVPVILASLWITLQPRQSVSAPVAIEAAATAQVALEIATKKTSTDEQTVLTTSSIPIHLHLHRRPRLEISSPPYGPLFARLQPLAQGGDSVAQYQLGLLLYECRDVPADAESLEREVEGTYQTRLRGGFEIDDPVTEDKALRRRYQDCLDVPATERDRYRDWLKQAADRGLLEAELALPLHLPQGEYCQYLADCAPAQRARQQALQQEAIEYITRARDAGSAAALWTLGGWYAEGEVLAVNDIEAYANFLALDQINQAAGQSPRFGEMLKSLGERLRPVDLVIAEAHANALLSNPNCCQLTP